MAQINPLQPPINYLAGMPQLDVGTKALQLSAALQKQQEIAKQEDLKKQFSADMQSAMADGSQVAWANMIAKYPQFREALGDVRKVYGEEKIKTEFNQGIGISHALETGRPEIAQERLQLIVDGLQNSGRPTGIYGQALDALKAGNVDVARSGINMALSIADPERFKKITETRIAATVAPADIEKRLSESEKAVADAKKAVAEAATAAERTAAELRLKQSEATLKEIQAKNEPLKFAFDLGLTRAQTASALAAAGKSSAETKKIALELEALRASGGVDPAKQFDMESKLRKEYTDRTKAYGQLESTYQNMQSSSNAKTGAGDIALITQFMKMLDPGSVVRETEFATARDTAGLFDRLANQAENLKSGRLFELSSKQRSEYVTLAKQYLDASRKKAETERKDLGKVINYYKLNFD